MRLKGFISEGRNTAKHEDTTRSKSIDGVDAIIAVQKNCQQAVQAYIKKHRIYRGIGDIDMFRQVDPSKHTRESANTYNVYTTIIDNHPDWKKYPKRSKSIICSTSKNGASPYGNLYCIFPKDGSNYGVCPTNDIWGSFSRTIGTTLSDFNWSLLDRIAQNFLKMYQPARFDTLSDLKKILKEMDRRWDEVEDYPPDQKVKDKKKKELIKSESWLRGYKGDFYKLLMELIVPGKNNFRPYKNPMSLPAEDTSHEVWTDGFSYMINEIWVRDNFEQLIKT